MKQISRISFFIVLTLLLAILGSVTAAALDQDPIVAVTVGPEAVYWQPQVESEGFLLGISGPDGFYVQQSYASGEQIEFSSVDSLGQPLADGVYVYGFQALTLKSTTETDSLVQTGSFAVQDGSFVPQSGTQNLPSPSGTEPRLSTPADLTFLDDVIISGNTCVGFDCVNGENFAYDTLILKENNLRIYFNDTSSSGPFPSNDWRIVANDSADGGASYFGVQDATGDRMLLTLEAGAPSHSLYVSDDGYLGLGTAAPAVELQVTGGDTPALRLDQDESQGMLAQAWDVAGNEDSFFVRDVTHGSRRPLRIKAGAPNSSLTVQDNGNVGLGTWAPEEALHVVRSGSDPAWVLERTDGHATTWAASAATEGFRLEANDAADAQLLLDTAGNLTIGGSLSELSDVNAKQNFAAVNPREVLETLTELPIQSWNFKTDSQARHIGPMAQDFYRAFGLGSDERHIAPLDTNGVALASIQGLYEMVEEKDAQIRVLEAQNAELEARLTALERTVGSGPAQKLPVLTLLPWLLCGLLLLGAGALMALRLRRVPLALSGSKGILSASKGILSASKGILSTSKGILSASKDEVQQ